MGGVIPEVGQWRGPLTFSLFFAGRGQKGLFGVIYLGGGPFWGGNFLGEILCPPQNFGRGLIWGFWLGRTSRGVLFRANFWGGKGLCNFKEGISVELKEFGVYNWGPIFLKRETGKQGWFQFAWV